MPLNPCSACSRRNKDMNELHQFKGLLWCLHWSAQQCWHREGTNHLVLKIGGFFCSILSIALDQDDFWKKNLLISIVSHQPIICNFLHGKVKGIYKQNFLIIKIQCFEFTYEQAHSHTHSFTNLQRLVWSYHPCFIYCRTDTFGYEYVFWQGKILLYTLPIDPTIRTCLYTCFIVLDTREETRVTGMN